MQTDLTDVLNYRGGGEGGGGRAALSLEKLNGDHLHFAIVSLLAQH